MSVEIKVAADKLYAIAAMAKKVTGSVITIDSKGIIVSIDGIWVITKANTVCEGNTSISFSSALPLAVIKKMQGEITITENGLECIFAGNSKTGETITATGEIKCLDAIPNSIEVKSIGEITSTNLAELLSMKLSSSLPTYMMFSKKSAVSFIINDCNTGIVKSIGNFDTPLSAALSKATMPRLCTILSALKSELLFKMETFECWDSKYIKLRSDLGMAIIVETRNAPVPMLPKQFTPPPECVELSGEELKGCFAPKATVRDRVHIEKGGIKTTLVATSVKPVSNVISLSAGPIMLSVSDRFTYFSQNNRVFIVGNAKEQ